ncbi:MAG: TonB-dependent receptor plug domain-containing protein [Steroidobacteraceae bacterium]
MNNRNKALSTAIRAVLMAARSALVVAPAYAQQAQQSQPTDQLEEITVYAKPIQYLPADQSSATGLELPIIDTPQAISVLTQDMLAQAGAVSMYDAADLVPGLNQGGTGNGHEFLILRGQQVTQLRIDDLNFGGLSANQPVDAFALERVEVVRGPATALYGVTGAFGGEVNQILKQPEKDFHADIGFEGGDFAERRYQADVTGAVPDTDDRLKIRVLGAYTSYGTFQNLSIPSDHANKLFLASLEFDATPATTLSLTSYFEDRNPDSTDGCPLAENQATHTLYFPFQIPVDQFYCGDPAFNRVDTTTEFQIASLTHKFDNAWTATVKAGYARVFQGLDYVYGFGPAGAYHLPAEDIYLYSYARNFNYDTQTVDMSLGGPFQLFERQQEFFAAVEYQKERDDEVRPQSSGIGIMNMFTQGGQGLLADGQPMVIPTPKFYNYQLATNDQLRGSVNLLLNPADRWRVLLGLLAQHTDLADSNVYIGKTAAPEYGSYDATNVLKRLGVTYDLLSEKKMEWLSAAKTYLSYQEGFEPNVLVFDVNGVPLTAPQQMKDYEAGLKTQWFDSKVNANLALYDSTRTNIPRDNLTIGTVGESSGRYGETLEGKNFYKGVEFELLGQPLPGWNTSLNYTFTHYEQEALLFPQELAVANVPKDTFSLMNSYEFLHGPLKGLILAATVVRKVDTALGDNPSVYFNLHYDPSNQVFESATIWNFRVTYRGFSGPLKGFELYANVINAFNAEYAFANQGNPGFSNQVMAPRAVTAGLNYRF